MNSVNFKVLDNSELQNRIVNISLVVFSIFLTLAHIGTTIRALNYGIDISYYIQSIDFFILLSLTLFRKYLNIKIKAYIIIIISFSVIFASLLSVGFFASARLYIIVIPIYLYFVLSYRQAIFTFVVYIILFIIFGYLYVGGFLNYNFNLADYIAKPVVWMIESINIIALSMGILIVIHHYSKSLINNYNEIQYQNEELNKNKEKYRAQYNYYPLPVFTIERNKDGNFIFTDFNEAARNYEYANAEMVIGKDIDQFLSMDREKKITQIIEKVLDTKKNDSIDIFYKYKTSNQERFLNLTFGYIPPETILMTVKDITDEKNAQIALKQSEEIYRAQYNYFPLPVLTIKNNNNRLIIDNFNEATRKYAFIDSEQLKGKALDDFFTGFNDQRFLSIIRSIFNTKETKILETEYAFKTTNSIRSLQAVCGFVPPDKVLLTLIDNTSKKKAREKMYYAMNNAEERERTRIAKELHDGVSPVLAAIKLYIQTFLVSQDQNVKRELSEKIFTTIKEAIQSVTEISNRLSPHILQNFGLEAAIQNFIEKISETTKLSFTYHFEVKSELNEKITVNVYRILVELINNTIKYADADTAIIKMFEQENYLQVYFEHNGKGFNLEKVIKNSKGMGLNNLFNRVNALRGAIDYQTDEDADLKVTILIPLN